MNITMLNINKVYMFFNYAMSCSQFCSFRQTSENKGCDMPCLKFFWKDNTDIHLEKASHIFSNTICPVLLETIIKGTSQPCYITAFHKY